MNKHFMWVRCAHLNVRSPLSLPEWECQNLPGRHSNLQSGLLMSDGRSYINYMHTLHTTENEEN